MRSATLDKTIHFLRECIHLLATLLSIACFPISLLIRLFGFRTFVCGYAIGHVSIEPVLFLQQMKMGEIPLCKAIILPPFKPLISKKPFQLDASNPFLMKVLKQHFYVPTNPFLLAFLYPLLGGPFYKKPLFFRKHFLGIYSPYFKSEKGLRLFDVASRCAEKFGEHSKATAQFFFPETHMARGSDVLRKWGIKKDDWFVCFNAREPGFYDKGDELREGLRNADINTYELALEEIVKRGGWCIRLGSHKLEPLSEKLLRIGRVIDYPKSEYCSPFMDVFLAANCRFFLGGASGITLLPGLFGVPSVVANLAPLDVLPPYSSDIAVPKLYYSENEKRMMQYSEIYQLGIGRSHRNDDFDQRGISLINNTPEEIKDAVVEMFLRIEGRFHENADYKQRLAIFFENIPDESWSKNACSCISSLFLEKHEILIAPSSNQQNE